MTCTQPLSWLLSERDWRSVASVPACQTPGTGWAPYGQLMNAQVTTELERLTAERDACISAQEAAQAEVERLRELVVALQVRLAVQEGEASAPRTRGLASLIRPPDLRDFG